MAGFVQVFGRRQDVLSTRSCGRRPKSAKARNRGGWGTRRGSERYGDLGGSCVPVRFDGSGPDDCLRSKNCGIDFERAPCALRERILGWGCGPVWRDDASGSAAGRERARMEVVDAVADRWCRHHEVSMLIAGGTGVGRCFGCCPRRKVSMMRMRPPQQGQGCSGGFGSSDFVLAALMASIGMSGTASKARIRAMLLARVGLASR